MAKFEVTPIKDAESGHNVLRVDITGMDNAQAHTVEDTVKSLFPEHYYTQVGGLDPAGSSLQIRFEIGDDVRRLFGTLRRDQSLIDNATQTAADVETTIAAFNAAHRRS